MGVGWSSGGDKLEGEGGGRGAIFLFQNNLKCGSPM